MNDGKNEFRWNSRFMIPLGSIYVDPKDRDDFADYAERNLEKINGIPIYWDDHDLTDSPPAEPVFWFKFTAIIDRYTPNIGEQTRAIQGIIRKKIQEEFKKGE